MKCSSLSTGFIRFAKRRYRRTKSNSCDLQEIGKNFIPAVCLSTVGLASPVVTTNREECWESAWHRLHETTLQNENSSAPLSITSAMLAKYNRFELFKHVADDSHREKSTIFIKL